MLNTRVALRLGRVSNLPTVWSNSVAAAMLAGARPSSWTLLGLALALSCSYVGGMYLNDAFDRDHDARERPDRPIPSGQVAARTVFAWGYGWLAIGLLSLMAVALPRGTLWPTMLAGMGLAGAILTYDIVHLRGAWASGIMGLCRAGIYVAIGLCLSGGLAPRVGLAAASLCLYVVGLTAIARTESRGRVERWWPALFLAAPLILCLVEARSPYVLLPALAHVGWTALSLGRLRSSDVGGAVVRLIAGICWIDALFVVTWLDASFGLTCIAMIVAGACVALTRRWQAHVPGT